MAASASAGARGGYGIFLPLFGRSRDPQIRVGEHVVYDEHLPPAGDVHGAKHPRRRRVASDARVLVHTFVHVSIRVTVIRAREVCASGAWRARGEEVQIVPRVFVVVRAPMVPSPRPRSESRPGAGDGLRAMVSPPRATNPEQLVEEIADVADQSERIVTTEKGRHRGTTRSESAAGSRSNRNRCAANARCDEPVEPLGDEGGLFRSTVLVRTSTLVTLSGVVKHP